MLQAPHQLVAKLHGLQVSGAPRLHQLTPSRKKMARARPNKRHFRPHLSNHEVKNYTPQGGSYKGASPKGHRASSVHGHDLAERRNAVLVERLNAYVVFGAHTERPHIEAGSAIHQ